VASKKNSSSPELELAELIGRVARRWHQLAERSFAALRLNHTEARVLTLLAKHGGSATQDTLSNQLNVDRSNAGRALSRLEADGLVVRRKHESDARAKLVEISEAGKAAVERIGELREEIAKDLLGGLSGSELRTISDLLSRSIDW
jgi:DNA-binding MarR family transcriptional regulator